MPIILEQIMKAQSAVCIGVITYKGSNVFAVSYGHIIIIYDITGQIIDEIKLEFFVEAIVSHMGFYYVFGNKNYNVLRDKSKIGEGLYTEEIGVINAVKILKDTIFIFYDNVYIIGQIKDNKIIMKEEPNDSLFYKSISAAYIESKEGIKSIYILGKIFKKTHLIKYTILNEKLCLERFLFNQEMGYVFEYNGSVFIIGEDGLYIFSEGTLVNVRQFGNNLITCVKNGIVFCRNGEVIKFSKFKSDIVCDFEDEIKLAEKIEDIFWIEFKTRSIIYKIGTGIIVEQKKYISENFNGPKIENKGIEFFSPYGLIRIDKNIKTKELFDKVNKNSKKDIILKKYTNNVERIFKTELVNIINFSLFSFINDVQFYKIDYCFKIWNSTILVTRGGIFILKKDMSWKIDLCPIISRCNGKNVIFYRDNKIWILENELNTEISGKLYLKFNLVPRTIMDIVLEKNFIFLLDDHEKLFTVNLKKDNEIEQISIIKYQNRYEFLNDYKDNNKILIENIRNENILDNLNNKINYKDTENNLKFNEIIFKKQNIYFKKIFDLIGEIITVNLNYCFFYGKLFKFFNEKFIFIWNFNEYILDINPVDQERLIICFSNKTILFNTLDKSLVMFDLPSFSTIFSSGQFIFFTEFGIRFTDINIQNYNLTIYCNNKNIIPNNYTKLIYYDSSCKIVYCISNPDYIGFKLQYKNCKIYFKEATIYYFIKVQDSCLAIIYLENSLSSNYKLSFFAISEDNLCLMKEFVFNEYPIEIISERYFIILITISTIVLYKIYNGKLTYESSIEHNNIFYKKYYFIKKNRILFSYSDNTFKQFKIYTNPKVKSFKINDKLKKFDKNMMEIFFQNNIKKIQISIDFFSKPDLRIPFFFNKKMGYFLKNKIVWDSKIIKLNDPINNLIVLNQTIFIFTKVGSIYYTTFQQI